jgi:hypothetical protein
VILEVHSGYPWAWLTIASGLWDAMMDEAEAYLVLVVVHRLRPVSHSAKAGYLGSVEVFSNHSDSSHQELVDVKAALVKTCWAGMIL